VSTIYVRSFPATMNLAVTVRFVMPWLDMARQHVYTLDVVDEQGRTVWRDDHAPSDQPTYVIAPDDTNLPHEDQRSTVHVTLSQIRVRVPAWYFVVVAVDGHEQARTPIRFALVR
jgi:hypothetical protein